MSMRNEERAARYVERFQSAVAGGGFEAFFHSDAGDHAQATLNALLIIGAGDAAALLRRAMWVFDGGEPPPEREARREGLSQVGETGRDLLCRLDESFRSGNDELTRSLTEYSKALEEPCAVN
jgi:Domain of unknown function (DUF4375)